MLELIFEFIETVRRSIDIDSRIYVIFDAKLNIFMLDSIKYLKIRYEIHKKNIEYCSKINIVTSSLKATKSINIENMYV